MKHTFYRGAAAVLCAALLCGCAAVLSACGQNSSSGSRENSASDTDANYSVYSPVVPDSRVDESEPGEEQNAGIGDTVDYQGKLSVTLDKVVEVDDVDKSKRRELFAELTITNNSDTAVDCSTLTHFTNLSDGEPTEDYVRDLFAAVDARKYYSAIGSDLDSLNQAIEPGQTVKGYVYMGTPITWKTLSLVYTPYKYYSNDTIIFDFDESKIEHYTGKLNN